MTAVSGDSIGDQFYNIASYCGDFNGDGFGDVLIGSLESSTNGYAKLFFGSAAFDTIPDLVFHSEPLPWPTCFASSCAFAGDVNNDGFDDILIGDPEYCPYWLCTGRAYLYLGGSNANNEPDLIFDGEGFWHRLGAAVSGAGDINGDGYDDWLICAPDNYPLGRIYLYYGSENPDAVCDVYFEGSPEAFLVFHAPMLGDINGDCFDDLIFYRVNLAIYANYPEIHLGSSDMDTVPDFQWNGEPSSYDYPIAGIGDINCDGYNDWLFHSNDDIWLYFGSQYPDTTVDLIFETEPPCTYIGRSACGGDINGDGINDLVLSGTSNSSLYTGQVLGYLGGLELDNHYDYFIDSGIPYQSLGVSLGIADVNGDSIYEVLAGSVQYESPASWGPGQVWFLTTQPVPGVLPHQPAIPTSFSLSAHPNPFNPTTTISFQLPVAGFVTLEIFDISGRAVGARHAVPLQNAWHPPGTHHLLFDRSGLSSGLYFCRIQMGDYSAVKKMVMGDYSAVKKMVLLK